MKLNRKLRQRCWLEVKHFVLDDSLGCRQLRLLLSILTSMSVANLLPFLLPFLLPKVQLFNGLPFSLLGVGWWLMCLEVHDVVLFVVLFVEEGNAQVVEVEADDRGQACEPFPMSMKVVEEQDGVLSYVFHSFVRRFAEQAHIYCFGGPSVRDAGSAASPLQVAFLPPGIARQDDSLWLKVIGKPQQQMQPFSLSQTHAQWQELVQFGVGVIGVTLVDDLRYEAEGKRAVNAVAATMAETSQPDDWICQFLHNSTAKIRIFSVTFKQVSRFLRLFLVCVG